MNKKYVLMAIVVLVMATVLNGCYYGRYSYRPEPRYYERGHREHHERYEHHHERH